MSLDDSVLPTLGGIDLYNRLQSLPVALYARLSENPDGTKESTDVQIAVLRREATERWPGRPQIEFIDDDMGATDPLVYRPRYEAMLAMIEAGQLGDVMCREQERISRHGEIWPRFKRLATGAGITHLRTLVEGDVPLLDGQSLGPDITNIVNAHYVAAMKGKQRITFDERARDGRPHGAQPYGYKIIRDDNDRAWLTVVPAERAILEQMVDHLLNGWSLADVARWLNAEQIPTKKGGKQWDTTCVKSAVTNPTAAGYVVQGRGAKKVLIKSGKRKGRYRLTYTHREIVGDGEWEAIIDRDKWEAVRALLNQPRKVTHKVVDKDGTERTVERIVKGTKRPARSYVLTGYVSCALCEAVLVPGLYYGRGGRKVPYYWCKKTRGGCGRISIKAQDTEDYVRDVFLDWLDSPAYLRYLRRVDVDRPKREKLKAKRDAAEIRRAAAGRAYGESQISLTALTSAEMAIDQEIMDIDAQIAELAPTVTPVDPGTLRDGWDAMELGERRQLLADYGCEVVVSSAVPGTQSVDVESRVTVFFPA